MNLKEWKERLDRIPYKVKEVVVSGGEPLIYRDIAELVNYMLDKKWLVSIATNMTVLRGMRIKRSWRLNFHVTYHHDYPLEQFLANYESYKSHFHRVKLFEIGTSLLRMSRTKPLIIDNKGRDKELVLYGPDGKLYKSHTELEMR